MPLFTRDCISRYSAQPARRQGFITSDKIIPFTFIKVIIICRVQCAAVVGCFVGHELIAPLASDSDVSLAAKYLLTGARLELPVLRPDLASIAESLIQDKLITRGLIDKIKLEATTLNIKHYKSKFEKDLIIFLCQTLL